MSGVVGRDDDACYGLCSASRIGRQIEVRVEVDVIHERADAAARHAIERHAGSLEALENAEVRVAFGPAASQRQAYGLADQAAGQPANCLAAQGLRRIAVLEPLYAAW